MCSVHLGRSLEGKVTTKASTMNGGPTSTTSMNAGGSQRNWRTILRPRTKQQPQQQQQGRPPPEVKSNISKVSVPPTAPSTPNETSESSKGTQTVKVKRPVVLKPQQVLQRYRDKLTPFERLEIFNYQEIYCIGSSTITKRPGVTDSATKNHGYDNNHSSYIFVPHDHIAYRYEGIYLIGKGSFGEVIKAYDYKLQKCVALKIIRNEKKYHTQAQVEIRILEHLRKQDKDDTMNVIHMYDYFTFRNHICITFELLSINLYELLRRNNFQGISLRLIHKYANGILQCLDALYKNKIIHCDIKPENILLQPGLKGVKVIDFGSSCYENKRLFTYIQSRFYRAPEVTLGIEYGLPIDMWSFGCVMVELFTGRPLLPGDDEYDQIACTIEVLGLPPPDLLHQGRHMRTFFTSMGVPRYCQGGLGFIDGLPYLNGGKTGENRYRGYPGSRKLQKVLHNCNDPLFLDFVRKCLQWDAEQRMTPPDALNHDWIKRQMLPPPATVTTPGNTTVVSTNAAQTLNKTVATNVANQEKLPNESAGGSNSTNKRITRSHQNPGTNV
jgi:dual specificity tyrosine-phosphorylation-regulated kinase 2/3/4